MRIGKTEILDEAITGISLSEALDKFKTARKCDVILIWEALNPKPRKVKKKTVKKDEPIENID